MSRHAATLALLLALAVPGSAGAAIGGFDAADGDRACTPGASGQDWDCLSPDAGLVTSPDATGGGDDVFTEGSKAHEPVDWTLTTGSSSGKTDFASVLSAAHETDEDTFLFLGFERVGTTGSVNLAFELNQSAARWTNAKGTSLVCRRDGDVLVSYENATVRPHVWRTTTAAGDCAAKGTWDELVGVASEGQLAGGFGEAAVHLDSLMNALGTATAPCAYFRRLSAHSRQSESVTSALGDYVADAPISVVACKDPDPGGGDATAPDAPTLTADADCQPGGRVTLRGIAEPGSQVQVREGSETVAELVIAAPDGAWSTTVEDVTEGVHTYTARARDAAGNVSVDSAPVTVDTRRPPPPSVTAPAAVAAGQDVVLTGAVQPGSTVIVQRGGVEIGRVLAGADGAWTYTDRAVPAGVHAYDVRAQDECAAGEPTRVSVTAHALGAPPAGGVAGDVAGGSGGTPGKAKTCLRKPFRVGLRGRGIRRVIFRIDGRRIAVVRGRDARKRFSLRVDPRRFAAGTHRIKARVVYARGKRKGRPRSVPLRSFRSCVVGACVSRRKFTIRVPARIDGRRVRSARVRVAGKRVKVVRRAGRLRARVDLRGLPKGRFDVQVVSRLVGGGRDVTTRTYRTCTKKGV